MGEHNKEHWEKLSSALAQDLSASRKEKEALEERLKEYSNIEPWIQVFIDERKKKMNEKIGDISSYLKELPSVFEKQQGKTPFIEKLTTVVNNVSDELKNKADGAFLNKQADETITVLNACASAAQIRSSELQKFLSLNTKLGEENTDLKKELDILKEENKKLQSEYGSLNKKMLEEFKQKHNNINDISNHTQTPEVITATASSSNPDRGVESLWAFMPSNNDWKSLSKNYDSTY
jgi:chromosome segregation ATPase